MMTLQKILKVAVEQGASDIHLTSGCPPQLRIGGSLVRVKTDPLDAETVRRLCYSVLTDEQKARFEETKELDISFGIKGLSRFRGNLFFQKGTVAGAFRRISAEIPNLKQLGIPDVVGDLTNAINGLILVTGPTGSGKSTTIAAMLDKVNNEQRGHILTIEDPVEYVHDHKKCVVNQREIGPDTWSFKAALKHLVRQDPDYCLIGEMRDEETIETALTVAETGHLVFGTLHTNSASQTITRIVNVFSGDKQERVRNLLSFCIQGVVSQQLVPTLDGGRTLAFEILIPTPAIRNLIRENKMHQLQSMMQTGQNKSGMLTMNQSLMSLLLKRRIDMKIAFETSPDPEELDMMMRKARV